MIIEKIRAHFENGGSLYTLIIGALMSMSPEQYISIIGAASAAITSMAMVYGTLQDNKQRRLIEANKAESELARYNLETELLFNQVNLPSDAKN